MEDETFVAPKSRAASHLESHQPNQGMDGQRVNVPVRAGVGQSWVPNLESESWRYRNANLTSRMIDGSMLVGGQQPPRTPEPLP